MERNNGSVVTVGVVLAALLGLTVLPTRKAPSSNSRGEQAKTPVVLVEHKSPGQPRLKFPCDEIEQRYHPFLSVDETIAPRACLAEGSKFRQPVPPENASWGFQFLIATVPDPVHTHLALQFDRLIESIRMAAQDEQYLYDSSWLPWVDQPYRYSSLTDQDKATDRQTFRESQPGILVFRNAQCNDIKCANPLLVFVVGENPSHGINEAQFANAISWIRALRPGGTGKPFHILGPSFSGSFASLARILTFDPEPQGGKKKPYLVQNFESIGGMAGNHATRKTGDGEPQADEKRDSPSKIDPRNASLLIFSGTATSQGEIERFSSFLDEQKHLGQGRFVAFQQSDEVAINRYCNMLKDEGYKIGSLAIISEEGTAYGEIKGKTEAEQAGPGPLANCIDNDKDDQNKAVRNEHRLPLLLNYPREISSLRSSYAKRISENNAQSNALGNPEIARTIQEPDDKERDAVQTYGGQQTLQSQDAMLLEIVNALKRQRIRVMLLRSSNVLDQIFLTSYFASRYPDGRIVLVNSDLLLQSITGSKGIRGTTTLSTYPQITGRESWTVPEGSRENSIFADSNSEGSYLAARFLLRLSNESAKAGDDMSLGPWTGTCCSASRPAKTGFLFHHYGPPWWVQDQRGAACMPTWVSVVGTRQVWPVAVLTEPIGGQSDSSSSKAECGPPVSSQNAPSERTQAKIKQFPMPFSIVFCFCVLLAACCWHAYCCCNATPLSGPRCRTYFVPVPGLQHELLVFFGCLLIVLLAISLVAFTETFVAPVFARPQPWIVSIACGAMLALSFIALAGSRKMLPARKPGSKAEERRDNLSAGVDAPRHFGRVRTVLSHAKNWLEATSARRVNTGLVALAVSAAIVFLLFYVLFIHRLTCATAVFAVWRSVHIFSGVSPLMPFLLLVVGSYGWVWCSLAGLALFNDDRPRLPDAPEFDAPHFSQRFAGEAIETLAKPLERGYALLVGGLFTALVAAFISSKFSRGFTVGSLGIASYGEFFAFWLCLCIAVMMGDAVQLLRLWSRLRSFLCYLDMYPLRRTLYGLKGFRWGNVWKMSGSIYDQRYRLLSRQMEALGHFKSDLSNCFYPEANRPAVREALIQQFNTVEKALVDLVKWYPLARRCRAVGDVTPIANFQGTIAGASALVYSKILKPAWERETHSLIQDTLPSDSGKAFPSGTEVAISHIAGLQRNGEEFIALVFLGFILNVLARIRTMVLGMFWLFMMASLSVVSYPFDPRPVLGGTLLAALAVMGTIVSLVYAGMHRNATLSHITNTTPGSLGWAFWMKLVGIGIGPLLAALSAFFPDISGSIVSWFQSGADAAQ